MTDFGILPEKVTSPMDRWEMDQVIFNSANPENDAASYSIAIGLWDSQRALVMRWNGGKEKPKGNPVSRGYPTWFVIPPDFHRNIIEQLRLDAEVLRHVRDFLGLTD